jgi:hypothetical protein
MLEYYSRTDILSDQRSNLLWGSNFGYRRKQSLELNREREQQRTAILSFEHTWLGKLEQEVKDAPFHIRFLAS